MDVGELGPVHSCCGAWPEHRYRCPRRVWPATATPQVRQQAVRGDCIAPAHARIEDLGMGGRDYQQRKRLTEILAQVWDDGFAYAQQIAERPLPDAAAEYIAGRTSVADAETRQLALYQWMETEVLLMDRTANAIGTASGDALAIAAQAEELRHVRDHMRQADPSLPVTEVDEP